MMHAVPALYRAVHKQVRLAISFKHFIFIDATRLNTFP